MRLYIRTRFYLQSLNSGIRFITVSKLTYLIMVSPLTVFFDCIYIISYLKKVVIKLRLSVFIEI